MKQQRPLRFNSEMEMSTSVTKLRKIQNEDGEKSKILQVLIQELRMNIKEKDSIILKLKIELALHEKLNNVDQGKTLLSSEANFKNEIGNKDKDVIKSAPANRCKCVERFRLDEIRNSNELKTVDDKGTTTHLVEDNNNETDPERASFSPQHCPEYHQPDVEWQTVTRRRPRRQPIPLPEQEGLVTKTLHRGAVFMVFGLDDDTSNTDKVFNLMCLYGNVVRIRILKGKGTAMVQMADYAAADRCVKALQNTPIGKNGRIQTKFSTKTHLRQEKGQYMLPDHTPGFKYYPASKNNKFLMPCKELAGEDMKNQPLAPTKFLFFWNTPCGIKESDLMKVFNSQGCEPKAVSMFPQKPEQQSSSGIIEFSHKAYAILAIMKCNHMPIESKGIMKLRFSSGNMSTSDVRRTIQYRI